MHLKERSYILDPTIVETGVAGGQTANKILQLLPENNFFPDLTSVVFSAINWRVTVSCPFDFQNFPFDAHECPLEMVLPFFGRNLTVYYEKNDSMNYDVDGFVIRPHELDSKIEYDEYLAQSHNTFGFEFHVKRQVSFYFFQYYLPSTTIVIASSISFIIPLSAIPGRVALVVTQFLTLTNIFIHQMVRNLNSFRHKPILF